MKLLLFIYNYMLEILIFLMFVAAFLAVVARVKQKYELRKISAKLMIVGILIMVTKDPLSRYIVKSKIENFKKDPLVEIFVNDNKIINKEIIYSKLLKINSGENNRYLIILKNKIAYLKFVKEKHTILQLILVRSRYGEKFSITTNYFNKDKNHFSPIGEIRKSNFFEKYMVENNEGKWKFPD